MENLEISGTSKIPTINFNANTGILLIKGKSILDNASDFYLPIINWLIEYSACPQPKTILNIDLEYFNTSSSKCILHIFRKLETIAQNNVEVSIQWFYNADDVDMLEAGENYESIINVPFHLTAHSKAI
ncbi:MAG: DUF1987 domain-containing protein [Bacteroidales bacterium]|jgi:hypothetical protein|nr:DUF1987 domain-containing protein [Bacteroidales bacterium]